MPVLRRTFTLLPCFLRLSGEPKGSKFEPTLGMAQRDGRATEAFLNLWPKVSIALYIATSSFRGCYLWRLETQRSGALARAWG